MTNDPTRRAQPVAQSITGLADVMEAVDYHAKACVDRSAGEPIDTKSTRLKLAQSIVDFADRAAQPPAEPAAALDAMVRNAEELGLYDEPATDAEPVAWLIRLTSGREYVHKHNAIGDFRQADPGAVAIELVPRPPRPEPLTEQLHKFLDAAAGEGLVLDGVDAADLYVDLFPERYESAIRAKGEQ